MTSKRHVGGSILPSAEPLTYKQKTGLHGTFETRPLPDLDTHGLFYARNKGEFAGVFILIAMHPNGYSCDELAKRAIEAWESKATFRAMRQFEYILACGGIGQSAERMRFILEGAF